MLRQRIQTALQLIYPPSCVCCGGLVGEDFALCGPCWRDTPFVGGLVCEKCGVPMLGYEDTEDGICDDCMRVARPWGAGRAAMLYHGNGRKMVLALKHGDRHEVARAAGPWLARVAKPLVTPRTLIAPIPLHWTRLLGRRFNQSALLAQSLARVLQLPCCPDLLERHNRTQSLEGLGRDARFKTLQDSMRVTARHADMVDGRPVLLVDDVMTSGATLGAAAEALLSSHSGDIHVVTLARVAKDA